MEKLRALWAYRGFVIGSVKREFQGKYKNSLLGAAWSIINPLAMVVVYTVIFSQVMGAKLPNVERTYAYSVYLCSGLLTWNFFAEIISRSQTAFIDNAALLKKINFPRACLPIIIVANAAVNFGILFAIFTLFLVVSGSFPGLIYFTIFPFIVLQVFFSIGLGVVLGVLNVFFRDVGHFFSVFMTFWFWMTPIVYPVSILPDYVKWIVDANPMSFLMGAYQRILVEGVTPNFSESYKFIAITVIVFFLGMHFFRRRSGEMVDEL